ncbi:MAG: FAD-binding protein [Actinobacteria bacterium]|nr:FAD-binding protein [Actinomycetota bacterium]
MATTATASHAERFRTILGMQHVLDGDLERTIYGRDGSIARGACGLVLLPATTAEVSACLRLASELGLDVVPRGSGTGLTGGAVPLAGAVVISVARMRDISEIDPLTPCAWVQPGVLNLDITNAVAHLGLHYAPDPSSQAACSIGGNIATNAGGPHCLASGVTVQHVIAVEWVMPDGEVLMLGGLAPDAPGLDLRGIVVGSEGTLGIATRICVRLTRNAPTVVTALVDFPTNADAGACCGAIIAGGVIPAAMEMMDQLMIRAVEEFVHADLPVDSAAMLLVELDGTPAQVASEMALVERISREHHAGNVRIAQDEAERAVLWKARKNAFGAVARVAPSYYLHDCVVPRTRLVEVLERIGEIGREQRLPIMNVFHAGDGNLHPLIAFDQRDADQWARVQIAGKQIIEACVAAGGVLTGEHGVGLEKRDFMHLTFTPADLDAQARLRDAFDPAGRMNPAKVLPLGSRCGETILTAGSLPEGTWL